MNDIKQTSALIRFTPFLIISIICLPESRTLNAANLHMWTGVDATDGCPSTGENTFLMEKSYYVPVVVLFMSYI